MLVDGGFVYEPRFARGVFLTRDTIVLQTEAIALDMAVTWIKSAIFYMQQNP